MEYYLENPNNNNNIPNPNFPQFSADYQFMSDYVVFDGFDVHHQESWSQSTESLEKQATNNMSDATAGIFNNGATFSNNNDITMQVPSHLIPLSCFFRFLIF